MEEISFEVSQYVKLYKRTKKLFIVDIVSLIASRHFIVSDRHEVPFASNALQFHPPVACEFMKTCNDFLAPIRGKSAQMQTERDIKNLFQYDAKVASVFFSMFFFHFFQMQIALNLLNICGTIKNIPKRVTFIAIVDIIYVSGMQKFLCEC